MRLDKYLATVGLGTRSEVKKLLRKKASVLTVKSSLTENFNLIRLFPRLWWDKKY